ncbi:protein phosphatase 1 regulatory subunit 37 isoform X1 [Tachysurus ichikawai]
MAEPNSDSGSGGVFCSRGSPAPEGGGCARGGFPSPRWHCAGGAALLLQRADRALCHSQGAAPVQLSLPDSLIINLFINCSAENRLARRASPWHRSAGVGRLARWGSTAKNTPVASEASSSPVIIYEQGSVRVSPELSASQLPTYYYYYCIHDEFLIETQKNLLGRICDLCAANAEAASETDRRAATLLTQDDDEDDTEEEDNSAVPRAAPRVPARTLASE